MIDTNRYFPDALSDEEIGEREDEHERREGLEDQVLARQPPQSIVDSATSAAIDADTDPLMAALKRAVLDTRNVLAALLLERGYQSASLLVQSTPLDHLLFSTPPTTTEPK